MRINFTKHALMKIEILRNHGISISEETFEKTIKNPDIIENGYKDRLIAQKRMMERHVLREVYEKYEKD